MESIDANEDERDVVQNDGMAGGKTDAGLQPGRSQGGGSVGVEDGMDVSGDEFKCTPCEEAERIRSVPAPGKPSRAEVKDHEITHCPYRSWCDHCVRGQAKDKQQRTVTGEYADASMVRVILDYCFFQEESREDEEDAAAEKLSLTVLVMLETLCHSIWAYTVRSKGASEAWVSEHIVADMETVGITEERLIVKADQENSVTDVQRAMV